MGVQPQDAAQQQALMTGQVAPLGISPEGSATTVLQTIQQQGGLPTSTGGTTGMPTQQTSTGDATQQSPTPTQGNGGATQLATQQQVTSAFAPSITGSPQSVLGQTPASSSSLATEAAAQYLASSAAFALLLIDALAPAHVATLYAPFAALIPLATLGIRAPRAPDRDGRRGLPS